MVAEHETVRVDLDTTNGTANTLDFLRLQVNSQNDDVKEAKEQDRDPGLKLNTSLSFLQEQVAKQNDSLSVSPAKSMKRRSSLVIQKGGRRPEDAKTSGHGQPRRVPQRSPPPAFAEADHRATPVDDFNDEDHDYTRGTSPVAPRTRLTEGAHAT